jgi:hypothetical protein
MIRTLVAICCLLLSGLQVNAFAPKPATFRAASCVPAAKPRSNTAFVLRMVSEEEKAAAAAKTSADGTFYDDEVSSQSFVLFSFLI